MKSLTQCVVLLAALPAIALAAMSQQPSTIAPGIRRYEDTKNGVVFHYPARWSFSDSGLPNRGNALTDLDTVPRAVVFFTEQGPANPYPHTTLTGADFSYATRQMATNEACEKALTADGEVINDASRKTVHGLSYTHWTSSDSGTCHNEYEDIYATYKNEQCYLFDLTIHTICAGVQPHTHGLTAAEQARVHASLETVFSSVTISDTKK